MKRVERVVTVACLVAASLLVLALLWMVFAPFREENPTDRPKAHMNLIMRAIDRYYDEKGAWPDRLADLFTVDNCRWLLSNTVAMDSHGNMVDEFGNVVTYDLKGPGKRPRLISPGPDKVLNTGDDIVCP